MVVSPQEPGGAKMRGEACGSLKIRVWWGMSVTEVMTAIEKLPVREQEEVLALLSCKSMSRRDPTATSLMGKNSPSTKRVTWCFGTTGNCWDCWRSEGVKRLGSDGNGKVSAGRSCGSVTRSRHLANSSLKTALTSPHHWRAAAHRAALRDHAWKRPPPPNRPARGLTGTRNAGPISSCRTSGGAGKADFAPSGLGDRSKYDNPIN